jgi:FMN phosphatase YigB (HAD superfamily)
MSLRAIVFDVSGTLLGSTGPIAGVADLWTFCAAHDIKLILAANDATDIARLHSFGYYGDQENSPATLGIRKPSPLYVSSPLHALGLRPEEAIYVGDSDGTNAYCAAGTTPLKCGTGRG